MMIPQNLHLAPAHVGIYLHNGYASQSAGGQHLCLFGIIQMFHIRLVRNQQPP